MGETFGAIVTACAIVVVATVALGAPSLGAPMFAAPAQGVYEDCAPSDGEARCLDRLQTMASAGFRLVINYSQFYGSAPAEIAYAKTAAAARVKIIWNFSEPAFWDGTNLRTHFGALAATCTCSDNAGFLRYVVGLLKGSPATWGYYVGDESPVRDHAKVRSLADALKRLDPNHPRMFVSIGDPSPALTRARLAPFADVAEVIGADFYPVSTGASIDRIAQVARNVRAVARERGRQSAIVLQAFDWGEYADQSEVCSPFPGCARFPTEDEMRRMRDIAAAGAKPALILWYSFFDIARSNNPARHWNDLVRAAGAGR